MKKKNYSGIVIFCLFVLDVFIWAHILLAKSDGGESLYFFDVGQGDSQMISLGDVQILIDGGPTSKVLGQLTKALSPTDRYIDLIILSHPQNDHFGGLIDVLKNYQVGLFINNGQEGKSSSYNELRNLIIEKKINYLALVQNDRVKYKNYVLEVLSPSKKNLLSKEPNDTGIVLMFASPRFKALFSGDIGFDVEKELVKKYDLAADVLKVAHHGSKFSSGGDFLKAVSPKISVIGVGKNSYGHPTKEVLDRLAGIGSKILRADEDGTVKLVLHGNVLNILTSR